MKVSFIFKTQIVTVKSHTDLLLLPLSDKSRKCSSRYALVLCTPDGKHILMRDLSIKRVKELILVIQQIIHDGIINERIQISIQQTNLQYLRPFETYRAFPTEVRDILVPCSFNQV